VPRGTIELANLLERIAILDPQGRVDKALEPHLGDDELRDLYLGMLKSRRFDERLLKLQRQGRIGTYGPSTGQEAASLGPVSQLTREDWFVPSFRETAAMLWRGWPMEKILLWWGGNEEGSRIPDGVNDLPITVPVGTQLCQAAGIAYGCKYKKDNAVVVTFIGDGATAEGDFHEAMNFAGVFRLPMICVVQNNQWAISLPRAKSCAAPTLAQRATAYGIDGVQADGNDLLSMIVATREAIARARAGRGPTLIEAVTYRLGVHTTADDPKKYREDREVEEWKPRDPLTRFFTYLQAKHVLDADGRQAMEERIDAEIRGAVERAEQYKPDPLDMFRHTYAEMPPHLVEQMQEHQAYLAAQQKAGESDTTNPAVALA
jgi:pyruvate dehydrogenase E1 component alpha subunit